MMDKLFVDTVVISHHEKLFLQKQVYVLLFYCRPVVDYIEYPD